MNRLDVEQIKIRLKANPDWSLHSDSIQRAFEFSGFLQSIGFVNRVAKIAQDNNHHPDIDIRWNKVTLTTTTHDEGGITEKDFALAQQCDQAFTSLSHP